VTLIHPSLTTSLKYETYKIKCIWGYISKLCPHKFIIL
jgi:hypothetical protein